MQLWHALAGPGRAEPCGLGARDTLRLEAGLPLYGNDIDDTVTPYEAGLSFIVKLDKGAPFTGEAALKKQKLEGVTRRLVGFTVSEPKVVGRHGMDVYVDGKKVDIVRSGTVTPTVNAAIGTTYVPKAQAQPGTQLEIDVRGKRVPAQVAKLPILARRGVARILPATPFNGGPRSAATRSSSAAWCRTRPRSSPASSLAGRTQARWTWC